MQMQKEQKIAGSDSSHSISITNLTAGAIWEPESFRLDRSIGLVSSVCKDRGQQRTSDGLGAKVVVVSDGQASRLTLAIFKVEEKWMLFDGHSERPLESVAVSWRPGIQIIPGLLSFATLILNIDGDATEIQYLRPSLRHWFEEGWALDDIDIGHLVARLSKNPLGLARLEHALTFGAGRDVQGPSEGCSTPESTD
jgi:hypothetical protein